MELIKLWEADAEKAYALQSSFLQDENGFINYAYKIPLSEYPRHIQQMKNYSLSVDLPEGYVPETIYILSDEDKYIGLFYLRHYLNDSLRNGSGHIGFGISKPYRGMGYATKGLALLLKEAEMIVPEEEFYLSVNKDNPASLKAQLKNGAYIHHEDEQKYYTRIRKNDTDMI